MLSVTAKVVKSVETKSLIYVPLRTFFERVLILAHADVAQPGRTPIDTGLLRQSLSPGGGATQIDPADPPQWAVLGTNVDVYPGVLEYSPRYHYADGPSSGEPTLGWLSKTATNIETGYGNAVKKLAADIEGAWG